MEFEVKNQLRAGAVQNPSTFRIKISVSWPPTLPPLVRNFRVQKAACTPGAGRWVSTR